MNVEEQQSSSTTTSNHVVNMSLAPTPSTYDVKKLMKMNEQENRCNDMEFELD